MKKALLFTALMLLAFNLSFSQATFETGAIGVDVNEYGKIELFNVDGIYQLWRTSILVGTSSTSVFDYQNDAEVFEPTVLVSNPSMSDYEIYGAYDNSYSGEPPAVVVKLNAYGWTGDGFIIVKFNIMNASGAAMDAMAGLDIIPYIDEVDGYDSVSYNAAEDVIRMHRGGETNIGMKLLSASLSSLYSFEYYDDYYVDSDYWTWMNYGSIQPLYASNSGNGSVSISSQAPVTIASGESFDVFYAMALGANEEELLGNMANATLRYEELWMSINDNGTAGNTFNIQNYPNPVKNSTTFSYRIPESGLVSLNIYDAIGNEVAVVVNAEQSAGTYTIPFNAENLACGMYFYTLTFNNQVRSGKIYRIK